MHQDVKILCSIIDSVIFGIKATQIGGKTKLFLHIANDIAFEMRTDLGNKIGVFLIAMNKMIHFHFNHLFNMRFLNVIGSEIKNDT